MFIRTLTAPLPSILDDLRDPRSQVGDRARVAEDLRSEWAGGPSTSTRAGVDGSGCPGPASPCDRPARCA